MKIFWKGVIIGIFMSVMGCMGVADYCKTKKEKTQYLLGLALGILIEVGIMLSIALPIALNS